ncbi:MAG: branched-chain alpha-keto acid dehydrogenase subunit E2 [Gammaproteobacteria bacterium]|nr:branched-chain alpha-keto acid dehydrogenase subunit E2 [Gammaproteobacteria bacterium]
MMALKEIRVPDLGSFKDVAVIELLVKPGDPLEIDTPIATLETEKATMDVPSPTAGILKSLHIERGAKVSAGDLVAVLEVDESAVAVGVETVKPAWAPPAASPSATPPAAVARPDAPAQSGLAPVSAEAAIPGARTDLAPILQEAGFSRAHAGPSVRRLARELGVDLGRVSGSGLKGRITHDDVKAWVKKALQGGFAAAAPALPKVPVVDHAAFGPVDTQLLSRIRRISGPRLHASWVNIPHITQFDEADISALEEQRQALKAETAAKGVKLTPLAFIVAACARALKQFPNFNASLDESAQHLVLKKYCHIGFAVDTPNGLMVPVIRDSDKKDLFTIAHDLATLSERARTGKLSGADMQGGCFTVSSLGGIGGTAFTPIINAPEVAILGVSRSVMKPIWRDGAFVPRLMLPLSLSYDHRVIDGAEGVRFTSWLAETLAKPGALA